MTSAELDNLVRIGKLKREPPSARELRGLLASACERLADADNAVLAFASRFDLAYNASHALALFALRHAGYRCDARYLAFQTLPHTLGMPVEVWRVLAKAHERRNLAEYEGPPGARRATAGGRAGGCTSRAGRHRGPAGIGCHGLTESRMGERPFSDTSERGLDLRRVRGLRPRGALLCAPEGQGFVVPAVHLGWNDGAGNPPNPNGLKTDYLWKRILTRAGPTHILENYAQLSRPGTRGLSRRRRCRSGRAFTSPT